MAIDGIQVDIQRVREDMVLKGWNRGHLATRAGVADTTVMRFLNGDHQTAKTVFKIAEALGHPVSRYIVSNGKKKAKR